MEGGEDTAESKLWGEEFERIGAQLTGRRMFDFSEPYWGDNPPFHAPVFVVTHRPDQRIEKQGGTSYTFVTGGVAAAVGQAREAAGGKDVLTMKYLLMIDANQQTSEGFGPEQWARAIAEQDAFNATYSATGELLGALGLADAEAAKVVRVHDGETTVTDGPFLETKEHLASYYLLDVESEQRALEIAAAMPFASFPGVEVWPVMHEAVADL